MSKLTEKEILGIAKLARLSISEEDLQKSLSEFNDILAHVEKLGEVKVPDDSQQDKKTLSMSPDEPQPSLPIEEVLKNAPSADEPFFYIPRVIEGGKS